MNASQDKPSIRFVGQADFASEVLQSGKRVLAVFMALWTRLCQVLEATLNEMVPACDGGGVVKIHPDDNLGRTPLIRFRTLEHDPRRPQRLFVPIASFDFESFVVTVRRFGRQQRPPTGIVLSRGEGFPTRRALAPALQPPLPIQGKSCSAKRDQTRDVRRIRPVAPASYPEAITQ